MRLCVCVCVCSTPVHVGRVRHWCFFFSRSSRLAKKKFTDLWYQKRYTRSNFFRNLFNLNLPPNNNNTPPQFLHENPTRVTHEKKNLVPNKQKTKQTPIFRLPHSPSQRTSVPELLNSTPIKSKHYVHARRNIGLRPVHRVKLTSSCKHFSYQYRCLWCNPHRLSVMWTTGCWSTWQTNGEDYIWFPAFFRLSSPQHSPLLLYSHICYPNIGSKTTLLHTVRYIHILALINLISSTSAQTTQ